MRASRGMGIIAPDKVPKGKTKHRKDGDSFTQYAKGGAVKGKNPFNKTKKAPKK